MRTTLIHHPGAGEGHWDAAAIREGLRAAGFDVIYAEMGENGWEEAVAAAEELVVVAGGDGTVAAVATRLGHRSVPLAILPTGSGNNIARSLGVFGPLDAIVPRLKHARAGPLRLCRARGSWGDRLFVESIGLGTLARSVEALQHEDLDGAEKLERCRESVLEALEAEPIRATVLVDGHAIAGDLLMMEAMNLAMIGPNLRLVPDTALAGDHLTVAFLPVADKDGFAEWVRAGAPGVSPLRQVGGRSIVLEGAPQPLRLEDKTRDWDGSRIEIAAEPHRVPVLRPGDR